MAIPSQTDMFLIVLDLFADGKEYSRKAAKEAVRDSLKLSAEDRAKRTTSGSTVYGGRVGWSISYLERAKLIDRVRKGLYAINDTGRKVQAEVRDPVELSALLRHRIAELNPWKRRERAAKRTPEGMVKQDESSKDIEVLEQDEQSPREQIESLKEQMDEVLGEELLKAILDHDSDFFEKLVVDLLVKMGYGNGVVTKKSGDGGIDGIISTDELGFHPIYTQAKRYDPANTVGREAIQSFAGALGSVRNGVFMTTSSFSRGAREFADRYPHSTISLIDGTRLVELMIKYDLGVTTESTIRIKRVDLDYFSDES